MNNKTNLYDAISKALDRIDYSDEPPSAEEVDRLTRLVKEVDDTRSRGTTPGLDIDL